MAVRVGGDGRRQRLRRFVTCLIGSLAVTTRSAAGFFRSRCLMIVMDGHCGRASCDVEVYDRLIRVITSVGHFGVVVDFGTWNSIGFLIRAALAGLLTRFVRFLCL
ncbi:hypothetical protein KC325_g197 [Hortaea werneckii]|nr:hypothetical protein KC325_g197 [Hortaea werneckii]